MENIENLCSKFLNLKSKSKVQDKIDTLNEYASDSDFCYLIEYLLNDDKITGIKKSKIKKQIKDTSKLLNVQYDSLKALIEYLLKHNTGKDQNIFIVQNFLNKIEDENDRQIITEIITKDFKCGVTDLTAYGHIPGLKRNWRERKGHSLIDNKTGELKVKKILDKEITVTLKLDGYRFKAVKQGSEINLYTASGKIDNDIPEIILEMKSLPNGVYDGEMIAHGEFEDSTARYNATSKILGKDGEKRGLDFIVFDYLMEVNKFFNYEEIKGDRWKRLYILEDMLEAHSKMYKDKNHVRLVPIYIMHELCTENTIEKIITTYEQVVEQGEEGLVIDIANASYIRSKGTSMYKLKPEVTGDFKVVDLAQGKKNSKFKDALGAFIVEYKNNTVNVGSGIPDALREEVWNNKEFYLNKLIEVVYFGETQDEKTGLPSMRLPRFKRLRHDKNPNDISYD